MTIATGILVAVELLIVVFVWGNMFAELRDKDGPRIAPTENDISVGDVVTEYHDGNTLCGPVTSMKDGAFFYNCDGTPIGPFRLCNMETSTLMPGTYYAFGGRTCLRVERKAT